ncbi:hypothetical protein SGL43_02321 [Streptomyces globisporus]|uniref:Uncharacterized protein n=1 Tax=Streptomyces globisporus TaxID=1908 RepID=A0ABN8V1T4_STRGL|nr:hypothetical protein SGL43_02321 [Streptomyces globisporus]
MVFLGRWRGSGPAPQNARAHPGEDHEDFSTPYRFGDPRDARRPGDRRPGAATLALVAPPADCLFWGS